MRVKIWGCRGSLPTPGIDILRYGGNSTCLEIITAAGGRLIVDAGSGIRNLGKALCAEKGEREVRFLFTHSHWDHLLGFPFFLPAYASDFTLTFCSGAHAQNTIRSFLVHQMEPPYFPVGFGSIRAKVNFLCDNPRCEDRNCRCAGIEVRPIPLNHPNGGYGYKFIEGKAIFVFLTDNELSFKHPGGPDRDTFVAFCRHADLLIHDAQYTDAEYERTRGWGHSTFADATDLAMAAGVRRLGISHHDPDRSDADLNRQVVLCQERIRLAGSATECFAVAEGLELTLEGELSSPAR